MDSHRLTAREKDVIRALLAKQTNNRKIGSMLSIRPSTVSHHFESIYNKLGVDNKVQLIVYFLTKKEKLDEILNDPEITA